MTGDVDGAELRAALHRTADLIADYLEGVGDLPVLAPVEPGDIRSRLDAEPPPEGESLDAILDDYQSIIVPGITHWNHPGFFAYFAISGAGPGIIGEALAATLNVNAMLWRTSPAATELEEQVADWVRRMVGLPEAFQGHINDTASISTLLALAAARHRADPASRRQGLAGRPDLSRMTVYTSDQAHSSVDKAMMALGLGADNLRRVASDGQFRLRPEALSEAIAEDRAAGRRPIAVVATIGTTSSTSVDPVMAVADLCEREEVWLHVDAAYAGSAAICEELRPIFAGWERADSIVLNPHKWLFTPLDCSLFYVRDPNELRAAFSLVPEYLRSSETAVTNLMDLGVQLGRRFRALKLWMVIRAFGVRGLAKRIRRHCDLATRLAGWIEEDELFELAAPVPFSLVCFRAALGEPGEERDRLNQDLMERVNAEGPVFLSHTRLDGRFVLRLAIGNVKTTAADVARAWDLLRRHAAELAG